MEIIFNLSLKEVLMITYSDNLKPMSSAYVALLDRYTQSSSQNTVISFTFIVSSELSAHKAWQWQTLTCLSTSLTHSCPFPKSCVLVPPSRSLGQQWWGWEAMMPYKQMRFAIKWRWLKVVLWSQWWGDPVRDGEGAVWVPACHSQNHAQPTADLD